MNLQAVLFDLDGTLLPMDQDEFVKAYFGLLAQKLAPRGYEPKTLIDAIWTGTMAMIKNTGEVTNETVFWDAFAAQMGEQVRNDMPLFDEYYRTDFQNVRNVCGFDPQAAQAVETIKRMGLRVALATNPIFPAVATESRMRWAGLTPEHFELYTTYENINYCKPNPLYFFEVARRMGVPPEQCLMVGNDVGDDTPAAAVGMKVFVLTDHLINKQGIDISQYPHGGFSELLKYLKTEC